MRSYYWRLREFDAVPKGFVGGVGQVNHHAQGIHFRHHLFAKGAQSAPFAAFCGTIGNGIVPIVGKGHITYPKAVKRA